MKRAVVFMMVILAGVAAPAAAQDPEHKINLNLGAGYTFAGGEVRNHLGDGYNFNVGVTFNLTPVIGVQGEYGFTGLSEKRIAIPVFPSPSGAEVPTDFFAKMNMQYVDANLVIKPRVGAAVSPYLIAGVGVYFRPVKVTTPSVGYVPGYCSPWWYVCSPGGFVSVENIIGERSSTDLGINVGGGLAFKVSETAGVYVEARYHYIWGPTVDASSVGGTSSQKANGQFFPITGGIRF